MQEDSMALTITLYALIGINLGWMVLAWEDRHGWSNLSKIKRELELRKLDKEYAEHFGKRLGTKDFR
jgi:hypothetical protein